MTTPNSSHRTFCYRCFKPAIVCICDTIIPIDNRTRVEILQHPSERNHPIGTVRFAMLGLKNAGLTITYPDEQGSLDTPMPNLRNAGLLYPSKTATLLTPSLPPEQHPDTLIVLDGTWSNAHKLYKGNPWLQQLPHYALNPDAPSRYRIRREPDDAYISTLEAIVEALRILEPQTDFSPLLRAFDEMIDRQIEFIESGDGTVRSKRPRKRPQRRIPRLLVDRFSDIVVVYTENIRVADHTRILVSCCARRMGDGAVFESFVEVPEQHRHRLPELTPSGILEQHQQTAIPTAQFTAEWHRFLRDTDVLCVWNKGTLKSLFQCTGTPNNSYLFLKAAYGNTVKTKFGTLEEVISEIGAAPVSTPFLGRAANRMGNAIAAASYLHRYGQPK